MKTIGRYFFIFLFFFLLFLPSLYLANDLAIKVIYQQNPYQGLQIVTRTNTKAIPTPVLKNGDADANNIVNLEDVKIISAYWNQSASGAIDQYQDGKVNVLDFAVTSSKLK
ncbi:MAG: hypothetical protein HQK53_14505 [Oligoflexia bacterium]|nr:hypothetical protein [Oligoflexia bacterium]